MKIVKRIGVFETNSSSTHTLTLVSKSDYEADMSTEKPKYRKYGVLDNKYDKLLMACGCCEEIFITEEKIDRYASWGDEFSVKRKEEYDDAKRFLENGFGDAVYFGYHTMSYDLAIRFIARVYCEFTGENVDQKYDEIMRDSAERSLNAKFFDNGSLNDSRWDYRLITELFEGDESDILDNLRHYFDDEFVLLYREYFSSLDWDDDDE